MSPLLAARAVSAGRLLIGAAMMAVPDRALAMWIGAAEASRPATKMVIRSFGFREVVLGGLGLHVAGRPGVGPRTLSTLAACDLVDLGVTAAARRDLPASSLPMMGGLAGGAALVQVWAARELS
jgi:hypothetical protein